MNRKDLKEAIKREFDMLTEKEQEECWNEILMMLARNRTRQHRKSGRHNLK